MNTKGQRKTVITIVLIGMICMAMVVMSAYAAELKLENNIMAKANSELQGEIDTLDMKIKSANRINNIADIASKQLGMVYANEDECVYLSQSDEVTGNLAMIIRDNAYH